VSVSVLGRILDDAAVALGGVADALDRCW